MSHFEFKVANPGDDSTAESLAKLKKTPVFKTAKINSLITHKKPVIINGVRVTQQLGASTRPARKLIVTTKRKLQK